MSKIIDFTWDIKHPRSGSVHTCRVCGKHSIWKEDWAWKYIIHKGSCKEDPGWEETYITCSDECRDRGI